MAAAHHVTSPRCPFMLRAQPGQKWNITLVDFATTAAEGYSPLSQSNTVSKVSE
jgi:hypothetical protein